MTFLLYFVLMPTMNVLGQYLSFPVKPCNLAAQNVGDVHAKSFGVFLFWRIQATQFQHTSNAI